MLHYLYDFIAFDCQNYRVTYNDIRQELIICGLDTPTFKQALENFRKISYLFDREFGEGILDDGHILKNQDGGSASAIEVSNRLFTPIKDAGDKPNRAPFEKGVDPKGHLASMLSGGKLVHTEENTMYYYKLRDRK